MDKKTAGFSKFHIGLETSESKGVKAFGWFNSHFEPHAPKWHFESHAS
jgi:hypothetical protein